MILLFGKNVVIENKIRPKVNSLNFHSCSIVQNSKLKLVFEVYLTFVDYKLSSFSPCLYHNKKQAITNIYPIL